MLSSGKVIGFVPTKESAQARAFYEGKLGFQFLNEDQFALVMRAGETTIRQSKGFHAASLHRPGLGSLQYRRSCRLATEARSRL